jgi:hypothetical protein
MQQHCSLPAIASCRHEAPVQLPPSALPTPPHSQRQANLLGASSSHTASAWAAWCSHTAQQHTSTAVVGTLAQPSETAANAHAHDARAAVTAANARDVRAAGRPHRVHRLHHCHRAVSVPARVGACVRAHSGPSTVLGRGCGMSSRAWANGGAPLQALREGPTSCLCPSCTVASAGCAGCRGGFRPWWRSPQRRPSRACGSPAWSTQAASLQQQGQVRAVRVSTASGAPVAPPAPATASAAVCWCRARPSCCAAGRRAAGRRCARVHSQQPRRVDAAADTGQGRGMAQTLRNVPHLVSRRAVAVARVDSR